MKNLAGWLAITVLLVLTTTGCEGGDKVIASNKNYNEQSVSRSSPEKPFTKVEKLELDIKKIRAKIKNSTTKEETDSLFAEKERLERMLKTEHLIESDEPIEELYGLTGRKVHQIFNNDEKSLREACDVSNDLLVCALLAKLNCPTKNEKELLTYLIGEKFWANKFVYYTDCEKGEEYYRKVCDLGDGIIAGEACFKVTGAHRDFDSTSIPKTLKNLKKHSDVLKKACELNYPDACLLLAFLHKSDSKLYSDYISKSCELCAVGGLCSYG